MAIRVWPWPTKSSMVQVCNGTSHVLCFPHPYPSLEAMAFEPAEKVAKQRKINRSWEFYEQSDISAKPAEGS